MGEKYKQMIPTIQGSPLQINIPSAIIAYSLMVLGLLIFVIPNVRNSSQPLIDSIWFGGMFGLIVYGIFDFTNAGVLSNWNKSLAVVDMLWGGFVYTVAAYIFTIF